MNVIVIVIVIVIGFLFLGVTVFCLGILSLLVTYRQEKTLLTQYTSKWTKCFLRTVENNLNTPQNGFFIRPSLSSQFFCGEVSPQRMDQRSTLINQALAREHA